MVRSGRSSLICDRFGISIPMVILPRSSLSVSGSILMEMWGWKYSLAMVVAAIKDMR